MSVTENKSKMFFALVDQYISTENKDYKTKNKRRVTLNGVKDITQTLKQYIETNYSNLQGDADVVAIITHLKSFADFKDLNIDSKSQVVNGITNTKTAQLSELAKTIIDGLDGINKGLKGIIDATKGGGIQLSHTQLRTSLIMYVAFIFLALSLAITQPLVDKYKFGQDKWGLLFACIYTGLLSVLFGITRHIGACVSLLMLCGACMALLYALG